MQKLSLSQADFLYHIADHIVGAAVAALLPMPMPKQSQMAVKVKFLLWRFDAAAGFEQQP
jgi:hypothetical protein